MLYATSTALGTWNGIENNWVCHLCRT